MSESPRIVDDVPFRIPRSGVVVKGTAILLEPPTVSLTDNIITRAEAIGRAQDFFTVVRDRDFPVRALLADVTNPGFVRQMPAWIVTFYLADAQNVITLHMDWMLDAPPQVPLYHGTVAFAAKTGQYVVHFLSQ